MKTRTIIALLVCLSTSIAAAQTPAPPQAKPVALIGGTVHTVSGPVIEDGAVFFEGGKIRYVGKSADAKLPPGTVKIDVTGKHVYPGMIGAHTRLGLTEIGSIRATQDYSEIGEINASTRAEVAFNPDSDLIPVARRNGVTLALSVPTGGIISGRSALMMLDGWTWESMTLKSSVGLHISWPREMSARMRRFMQMRGGTAPSGGPEKRVKQIKEAFAQARAYMKAKAAEGNGTPAHDSDLRWEAMIPVLKGEVPAYVHADGIREIQQTVAWAEKEGVKLVIVGGGDAWRVTDLLKTHDVPVIISGIHNLPRRRWEGYDTPYTLPLKLHQAGVKFCIATRGDASNERNLPYHAATAAAYGLPKDVALKAVTLYPAQILGVGDRVGSIEPGKDATVIVTTGDPLEIRSNVVRAFIQGRDIDLDSKHERLHRKYREKFRQLGIQKRTDR